MKTGITILSLFILLIPLFTGIGSADSNKNSWVLFVQTGINAHTATENPFERFPSMVLGFEAGLGGRLGIGGSLLYTKWSDYLGLFCGKFSFHTFRPSLDLSYHFFVTEQNTIDLFGGTSLAYNLIRTVNELDNQCQGGPKNHLNVSLFLGSRFFLFSKAQGILKKIAVSLKLSWILNGDFSGLYALAGLALAI